MHTFIVLAFLSVISCSVSGNSTTDLPEKSILRYGFQNTQECQDYEKAFICVQKCQDLNYDSAFSDRHCKCTCYSKPEILKHKMKTNTTRSDWKSGAPTTKLPIWAQTTNTDKNNIIDNDDDDHTTDNESKGSSPNKNESSEITTEVQGDTTDGNSSTEASSDNSTDTSNIPDTETANATGGTDNPPETDTVAANNGSSADNEESTATSSATTEATA